MAAGGAETERPIPVVSHSSACRVVAFRLRPDDDLLECIDNVRRHQGIKAGFIVSCVGSLTQAVFRFANKSSLDTMSGHFEIVSLVGTVSEEGNHLHMSVADGCGRTIGGHAMPGCKIYTTAEIVVGIASDLEFTRPVDPATTYDELCVAKKA
jgi:predicted DNA-binding protein with PD1-like motif